MPLCKEWKVLGRFIHFPFSLSNAIQVEEVLQLLY
jgi:hypothetical protein